MNNALLSRVFGALRTCAVFTLLSVPLPHLAKAGSLAHVSEVVQVEVLFGWREADGSHVAGVRFRLQDGWKTYWRSAGSAGIAPRLDWSQSTGVREVRSLWPTPRVFRQGEAQSIGYESDFVLPLHIYPSDGPRTRMTLAGRLDIGVCADICLPARLSVSAELPPVGASDPGLHDAMADRPQRVPQLAACRTQATPDGLNLTGEIDLPALGGPEAVVFEVPDRDLWVTDALVQRQGERLTATSELIGGDRGRLALDGSSVRITVIGQRGAVELAGCEMG